MAMTWSRGRRLVVAGMLGVLAALWSGVARAGLQDVWAVDVQRAFDLPM